MKIVVFSQYFYPHEGGAENYVYNLFKALKGIDVSIVTANTENSKEYEEKEGLKIYRLPCWLLLGGTYPVFKPEGLRILKKFKEADYVITQTRFFNSAFVGCRFALRNKIKLIHFEHGAEHVKLENKFFQILALIYDHIIGRCIIKKSWKVIGISNACEKFIKHLYGKETFLIRNGIDAKLFNKRKTNLKKRLGIKKEKVIIFIGRIIYAKGVQDLLEATKDMEKIKVIVVGDGNYLKELKRMNFKNAIFVGKKNQKEIVDYLSIADVFVNPSYAEGLPTSVLEAGAMGVPVIATDVGGTREIINDGKQGFLIKPKDVVVLKEKILQVVSNPIASKSISRKLRDKIHKDFDLGVARKRFLELIK